MRSFRLVVVLAVALAAAACDRDAAGDRSVPDAPVQGGEALQVEVDPEGVGLGSDTAAVGPDTQTMGRPGVSGSPRDTL